VIIKKSCISGWKMELDVYAERARLGSARLGLQSARMYLGYNCLGSDLP